MEFNSTPFNDLFLIKPTVLADERGEFFRTFCEKEFTKANLPFQWVQMNHSINTHKGTIRGMHYQKKPYGEFKLIRCIRGSVMDVVVDLRKNSTTFLKHFSVELSYKNKVMLLVPPGFAHGFQTLEDSSDLLYMHSAFYAPEAEAGVRYNDPFLQITWPHTPTHLSERDKNHPLLNNNFIGE